MHPDLVKAIEELDSEAEERDLRAAVWEIRRVYDVTRTTGPVPSPIPDLPRDEDGDDELVPLLVSVVKGLTAEFDAHRRDDARREERRHDFDQHVLERLRKLERGPPGREDAEEDHGDADDENARQKASEGATRSPSQEGVVAKLRAQLEVVRRNEEMARKSWSAAVEREEKAQAELVELRRQLLTNATVIKDKAALISDLYRRLENARRGPVEDVTRPRPHWIVRDRSGKLLHDVEGTHLDLDVLPPLPAGATVQTVVDVSGDFQGGSFTFTTSTTRRCAVGDPVWINS